MTGFEKSLSQTLSGINLENDFVNVEQKEVLKKDAQPRVIDFSVIILCF